jgi:hypothetical protein
MAKGKSEEQITLEFRVSFPEAKKGSLGKKYSKFVSLMQVFKDAPPIKLITNDKKKQVTLDAKNFLLTVTFGKRVKANAFVNKPYKNKKDANAVCSKIVNYLNTVLGDESVGAHVSCMLMHRAMKLTNNIAAKCLGDERIARVSEVAGQSIKPLSIGFDYTVGEKDFLFLIFTTDETNLTLASSTLYKDKLPFNLLEKEIDDLNSPEQIFKKLIESEV